MSIDHLRTARDAYARHDWSAAYDTALAAPARDAAGERLDLLADAAWWLGRLDDCIAHREAAYRAFDELGDNRGAGQCAVWLYEHHLFKGQPAAASGWLRRASRSLDADRECVEYGALVLRQAEAAHGAGDLDAAAALATSALDLGRRLRSPDLEAEALQTLGRVLIDQGRPAEGLAHLDEAMLFAVEGRLRPYSAGKVYCSLIGACEDLGDVQRAAEWTDATTRWAAEHPFAVFPGICRVHHAIALDARGALADAEREAVRACVELIDMHRFNAAAAFVEVGDIRRRLGDLAQAEEAFAKADELSGRPCSGMALLRLAQGRIGTARAIITRCVENAQLPLARARVLPAFIQILLADSDIEAATRAANELGRIADDYGAPALFASARLAGGRLALVQGDTDRACAQLHDALTRWQELDVPYEVATVRTLLGQALRQAGDEEGAAASFAAAEALFDHVGARIDARQARDLTDRRRLPAGLTEREVEVLRLIAAGQTNKEIAAALVLSEKTVSRHLSNIFTKIGVSTRAAATAYAFEQRIVTGRR